MAIGRVKSKIPTYHNWSGHSQTGLHYRNQKPKSGDEFVASEPEQFAQLKGQLKVAGHPLSDPQHSSYPSSRYEIRCYAPAGQGQVACLSFQQLLESQRRPFQSDLRFVLDGDSGRPRSDEARLGAVAPKDHSLRVDSMDVGLDGTQASQVYLRQLSLIGEIEQFQVRALVKPEDLKSAERKLQESDCRNYQLQPSTATAPWLEDYSEPLLDGSRVVPALFNHPTPLSALLRTSRNARYLPLGLKGYFTMQGGVQVQGGQQVGGAQGVPYGEKIHQAQSYIEGGNLLSGRRADGTPYLLVGKDSMELSRDLLSHKLGRPATDLELQQMVAADYGVEPDQVVAVEQPGEFHLDMRMMPLAPGVIALQDSLEAARLQTGWITQEMGPELQDWQKQGLEQLNEVSQTAARYEELAQQDLQKAGFKVVRMAGVFRNMDKVKEDGANFFNARHGTNSEGEKYTIMMGGTAQEEAYLAGRLLGEGQLPVDRLYFLDPEPNRETLSLQGGMKCRTKTHGQLA